jgi:phosphate-selective porin OprO/OprP
MERSLTDALVERRNLGVVSARPLVRRRGTGSIGVFREMNNDLDTGDGMSVTGRVTVLPLYEGEGRRLLHLGGALSYREPGDDTLRFLSRPESNIGDVLVDTGFFAAKREVRGGLEAAYLDGPFSIQGEAMLAAVDGVGDVGDPLFPTAYLTGSYIFTGERRRYRRNVGAFGAVFPDSPWGAWEAVARYSYLDLDSEGVQGGVLHGVTLGGNWYVTAHGRVMFNFVAAHPEGSGVQRIAQIRLQVNL